MLKANMATVDALTWPGKFGISPLFSAQSPPTGMLQPFHKWMRFKAEGFVKKPRTGAVPMGFIVTQA